MSDERKSDVPELDISPREMTRFLNAAHVRLVNANLARAEYERDEAKLKAEKVAVELQHAQCILAWQAKHFEKLERDLGLPDLKPKGGQS